MEALPFADQAFDVVTGINSFQFAGDLVQALREARRVCRPQGVVSMVVWGRREACDLLTAVMPAVFALAPPSPPAGKPMPALAEPGVIETVMATAGIGSIAAHDLAIDLVFPSREVADRAILSASARAIDQAGEQAVELAVSTALAQFVETDGQVRLASRFRQVVGRPAHAG
jgi:SAM-dependent methyltransferase